MNIFSNELYLSIILALTGFFIQFILLVNGLKEQKNLNCNLWYVILSRKLYENKGGYTSLILFALADFYITILLFLYIILMLLKFVGIHILIKKNKFSGHHWNDIYLIISLCLFIRLYSIIKSYINI